MADQPRVTLVVVPRERASGALAPLRSLYENAGIPFDLVYVDGSLTKGAARPVRDFVRSHGHRFVRSRRWLYPHQARNIGLRLAKTPYIVFVDNDVVGLPGWLRAMVECAEETGAGVVGPIYLEGRADDPIVHCAGAAIERVARPGGRKGVIGRQFDIGLPLRELPEQQRQPTGLVEFRCVLIRKTLLDAMGGQLDEGIKNTRDHIDLGLFAEREGFAVYLDPAAQMRYANRRPIRPVDYGYYMFRWSAEATLSTVQHFEAKWDLDLDPERQGIMATRRRRAEAARQRSMRNRMATFYWRARRLADPVLGRA